MTNVEYLRAKKRLFPEKTSKKISPNGFYVGLGFFWPFYIAIDVKFNILKYYGRIFFFELVFASARCVPGGF